MKIVLRNWRNTCLLSALMACGVILSACDLTTPTSTIPVSRDLAFWQERFAAINERVRQGNVDLIFIGDSITHGWEAAGKATWDKYYGDRNAANLGIGGDCTQHVLWRLKNGNLDGISPKMAVVHIGTNNFNDTPHDIAAGVEAIVKELRQRLPATRILLLAIFPRGDIAERDRQKLKDASAEFSILDCDPMVDYMDIGDSFLDADGAVQTSIMPDLLHLSEAGYQLWADAIEPKIAEMYAKSLVETDWNVLWALLWRIL